MKKLKRNDPEKDFRDLCIQAFSHYMGGNVRAANRLSDKILLAVKEIAESKETAESTFRRLANDPVPEVAYEAATYLLHFDPKEAQKILHRIHEMDVPWQIVMHIEANLSRWKDGSMDLSWLTDEEKTRKKFAEE